MRKSKTNTPVRLLKGEHMQTLNLIDTRSLPGRPVSRFITKREYYKAFPGETPRRISLIFKRNNINEIENKIAFLIMAKYPSIKVVDKNLIPLDVTDELDKMQHRELLNLAARMRIEYKIYRYLKKPELIKEIRKLKLQGIEPMSREEHEKIREEKRIANNLKLRKMRLDKKNVPRSTCPS